MGVAQPVASSEEKEDSGGSFRMSIISGGGRGTARRKLQRELKYCCEVCYLYRVTYLRTHAVLISGMRGY